MTAQSTHQNQKPRSTLNARQWMSTTIANQIEQLRMPTRMLSDTNHIKITTFERYYQIRWIHHVLTKEDIRYRRRFTNGAHYINSLEDRVPCIANSIPNTLPVPDVLTTKLT
jgi:hypothetical protein